MYTIQKSITWFLLLCGSPADRTPTHDTCLPDRGIKDMKMRTSEYTEKKKNLKKRTSE